MEAHEQGEVLTGVFYVDTTKPSFTDMLNLVDEPLATLPESRVRPCARCWTRSCRGISSPHPQTGLGKSDTKLPGDSAFWETGY